MTQYLQKETIKGRITREDNNTIYSVAIKNSSVVYTPGSPNEESMQFSYEGAQFSQNNIISREAGSITFDVLEISDPASPAHLEWDQMLKNNALRFAVQITENVTAKVKSYDLIHATMTIGANENGSFSMTLKGDVANIVK